MSNLSLIRRISLDGIADGWDSECFIRFKTLKMDDLNKMASYAGLADDANTPEKANKALKEIIDTLRAKFVDGTGKNDAGEHIAITKDDIEDVYLAAHELIMATLMHKVKDSTDFTRP